MNFRNSCEQNSGYAIELSENLYFCNDLINYDTEEDWFSACEQFGDSFLSLSCNGYSNAGDNYSFFYDEIMANDDLAPYYSDSIPYIHSGEVSPTTDFFSNISLDSVFPTFLSSVSVILSVILVFIAVRKGINKILNILKNN